MEYKNTFRKLIVWEKAEELALAIHELTKKFPTDEKFAIVSQMRRAAYSIMANIAEGNAKRYKNDRCNFFNIAQGSLIELDCFIELSFKLKYIDKGDYDKTIEIINKTGYLLWQFIKSQK